MKCPSCGNPETGVVILMTGENQTCEQCDPVNMIQPVKDYICPYNGIYCMWEIRNGILSACNCCWFKDDGNTSFAWVNRTLLKWYARNKPRRLLYILSNEKETLKFFRYPERVNHIYDELVIRMNEMINEC